MPQMRKGVSGGQDGATAPDGGGGAPGGEKKYKEIGVRRKWEDVS